MLDQQQLQELRKKVVASLERIALESSSPSPERIQALLQIIRTGGASNAIFNKSYELIEQSQDDDDKLGLLLDLLFEIDAEGATRDGQTENREVSHQSGEQPSIPTDIQIQ